MANPTGRTNYLSQGDGMDWTKLEYESRDILEETVIRIQEAILEVFNMKGDNRCWLAYFIIYEAADIATLSSSARFPKEDFGDRCDHFIEHSPNPDQMVLWENAEPYHTYDVSKMNDAKLRAYIRRCRKVIGVHYRKFLTGKYDYKDDQKIIALLPQKIIFDTRLPDREKMRPNCDRFYECKEAQLDKNGFTDWHRWE